VCSDKLTYVKENTYWFSLENALITKQGAVWKQRFAQKRK